MNCRACCGGLLALVLLTWAQDASRLVPAPADLEERSALEKLVAWAAASAGELVLVSADDKGVPAASWTVLQLRAIGYQNGILLHVAEPTVCGARVRALRDVSCAWSSWAPGGRWHRRIPLRHRLFVSRKRLLYRLAVEGGLSVLQTDSDTVWFANPFPLLGAPPLRAYAIVLQEDSPWANGGVLYVRGRLAAPGTPAASMLRELVRALDTFSRPLPELNASVRAILPWLGRVDERKGWMDEQNHLNDALMSSVLGRRVWVTSVLKSAMLPIRRHATREEAAALAELASPVLKEVRREAASVYIPPLDSTARTGAAERGTARLTAGASTIAFCGKRTLSRGRAFTLLPLRSGGGGGAAADSTLAPERAAPSANTSRLLVAPPTLFAHASKLQQLLRGCASAEPTEPPAERAAAGPGAADVQAPACAHAPGAHATVTAMAHLAGLPKGVRHAALRLADADGRQWARRLGADNVDSLVRAGTVRALGVRGFAPSDARPHGRNGSAAAERAERGVVLPLLELSLCLGREPVLPLLPVPRGAGRLPLRTPSRALLWEAARALPCGGVHRARRYAWLGCDAALELHEPDLADIEAAARGAGGAGVARVHMAELLGAQSAAAAAQLLVRAREGVLIIDGGGAFPLSALARLRDRVLQAALPAAAPGARTERGGRGLPGCAAAAVPTPMHRRAQAGHRHLLQTGALPSILPSLAARSAAHGAALARAAAGITFSLPEADADDGEKRSSQSRVVHHKSMVRCREGLVASLLPSARRGRRG